MTTRAIFLPLCALLATGVLAGCGDSDTVSESDVAGGNTVTTPDDSKQDASKASGGAKS